LLVLLFYLFSFIYDLFCLVIFIDVLCY